MKKLFIVVNKYEDEITGDTDDMNEAPDHHFFAEDCEQAFEGYFNSIKRLLNNSGETYSDTDICDIRERIISEIQIGEVHIENGKIDLHIYNSNIEDWDDVDMTLNIIQL